MSVVIHVHYGITLTQQQQIPGWEFIIQIQMTHCLLLGLVTKNLTVRIKSGEQGIPVFSVPRRLGGVICKPEGAA